MSLLLFGWALHMVAAQLIPHAWWVPDLTSVGLVLGMRAGGRQAVWLPLCAGALTLLWAIRAPAALFFGYAAFGMLAWSAARIWNLADTRIQAIMTFALSSALGWILVWADGRLSWPLILAVMGRSLGSAFCAFILGRWLVRRRRMPEMV